MNIQLSKLKQVLLGLLIIFLSMLNMVYSQTTFAKYYGYTDYDFVVAMAKTPDGGYLLSGQTYTTASAESFALAMKVNSSGNISWRRLFGGTQDDDAFAIAATSDGGCIVAGETNSFGAGAYDVLLIKLNSSGNIQWRRTFGGTADEWASSVAQTSDGGYIVAGVTSSVSFYDALVIRLNSSGNITWRRAFGGTGWDDATYVAQTSDGGFIVAGRTQPYGSAYINALLVKLNSSGNIMWRRDFGGAGNDNEAFSVAQTSDGGYILHGVTYTFGAGSSDNLIIKLNSSGNIVWRRTFGGTGLDFAKQISQTSEGGYILLSLTDFVGNGGLETMLAKLNSSGNTVWQKTFGDDMNNHPYSIVQTTDGGFAITGWSEPIAGGNVDSFLIKLNSLGNIPACDLFNIPSFTMTAPNLTVTATELNVYAPDLICSAPALTITAPVFYLGDICI